MIENNPRVMGMALVAAEHAPLAISMVNMYEQSGTSHGQDNYHGHEELLRQYRETDVPVSATHLRAPAPDSSLVCRLLLAPTPDVEIKMSDKTGNKCIDAGGCGGETSTAGQTATEKGGE